MPACKWCETWQGKDSSNAAREFVHYIAEAITEKCAGIIAGSHFMSILSDGSQARKTSNEKELVLVRVERNGVPIYFVVSLLEMASLGGGNSHSIKATIDSIFQQGSGDNGNQNGAIPLGGYREKVVSATADGANVNLGVYSGVLTQMKQERDWLVIIHRANYRLELALKDAVKQFQPFREIDSFYKDLWNLFKNSGKLKAEVKKASEALDITHYTLPKIHGTRFLNHIRRGLAKLLHNWPSYIVAFDNALASRKGYTLETKAKIAGFSKKFKSYPFLCKVAGYILEIMGPLSLVFEKHDLMAFEIPLAVETVIDTLEEIKENSSSSDYFSAAT